MQDLLVILARYPTLGKVKTRLAAEIGKAGALRVYRHLLDHHRREFRHAEFDIEWRYTPARSPFARLVVGHAAQRSGVPTALRSAPCVTTNAQPPGDLGERMRKIFAESFAAGYRRVVLIGTDAPRMNQATVRQAFAKLRRYPAVFQPTDDGGYALIGLREPVDVFTGIEWSTERVMAQTRQRLRALQLRHAELPVTFDVDVAADWRRFTSSRHQ